MEPSADHLIQRAWAAYQSDYHELAEREARGALVIEPNHAEASSLLSMCALQRRDRDGAVKFASQAIESAPHFAIFHYRLALIHGRFGDHLKAEPAVQTSLAHDPEFAPAYSLYAWIHHARGDVTTALDTVNEALRFDPNDEHALTLRIELLAEAGFVELSDKAANVALEIYPNSAHVHATIGALKLKHRQHHLAAVHLRESSRLAPGKRLVRNQFVQALEKRS